VTAASCPSASSFPAYRIVQEALTNALKHAGRARAAVRVRYGPDSLELEITDDGAGIPADIPSGGHGLAGIRATRRIVRAQPATRVLILTTFGLDDYVYDALRAGASGFMLKDAPPEEIAAAVRIVASGDALLAPAVTRAVIEEFTRVPPRAQPALPRAVGELTPRERQVLDLLIHGLSNPEICRQLVISEATAKTHVARILQQLGLRDRVQAVIYAYESGLVSPGPAS
jgi:DNA-binding NarL/FixJ family response regulator